MNDGGASRNVGHRVQIGTIEQGDGRIALRGEFDMSGREALRGVLGAAYRRGHSTPVDLSGVTFMDVGCTRELAFWRLLGLELLTPVNPSWQADLSLAACGLVEWADPAPSAPRSTGEASR